MGQTDINPIRSSAVMHGVPCITTMSGAQAAVNGIESVIQSGIDVKSIQDYLKE